MPLEQTQDQYSSWVGLIYVFNLIVGTGALTLPAAFARAGWLLSLMLIILLAFVGFVTVTFIIETLSCANATKQWQRIQSHKVDGENDVPEDSETEDDNINEETAIINRSGPRKYYSLSQQIELGEMAELYFNKFGRTLFYLSLCIYLYGDLTIYAAAISKTMCDIVCMNQNDTENFNLPCWENSSTEKSYIYRIFVLLFILLVGPFTFFNVQKTKYLQMFTTTMRWVAFSLMITLASVRIFENGQEGHPQMVEFNGLPALIGASVYSFMCHHSLPALITPFVEKQHVVKQLALDYILICSFYILLALTGIFAFKDLYDLYTLNFVPDSSKDATIFMKVIMYFLRLFPVFTLSTSFPIIAITLRKNLESLYIDENIRERSNTLLIKLAFPIIAVVPPVLVALTTHNLSSLVKITGSYAGTCIQYFIPAFLVLSARRYCKTHIGETKNKFASPFKSIVWIIFVICWAIACIILVTVNLITESD